MGGTCVILEILKNQQKQGRQTLIWDIYNHSKIYFSDAVVSAWSLGCIIIHGKSGIPNK